MLGSLIEYSFFEDDLSLAFFIGSVKQHAFGGVELLGLPDFFSCEVVPIDVPNESLGVFRLLEVIERFERNAVPLTLPGKSFFCLDSVEDFFLYLLHLRPLGLVLLIEVKTRAIKGNLLFLWLIIRLYGIMGGKLR